MIRLFYQKPYLTTTHLNLLIIRRVILPETLLNDYTFEPANHPSNIKHVGFGIFYKNSLPVNVR